MRILALTLVVVSLTSCGAMFERDQTVVDRGGQKYVLANGVCLLFDETIGDTDRNTRVSPANCKI